MIGLSFSSNLIQIDLSNSEMLWLKRALKSAKRKMGNSEANNSKMAEDGAILSASRK